MNPPAAPSPSSRLQTPGDLLCEYLRNPLGLDERAPCFCWALVSSRRGQAQQAYQVLVASRRELLDQEAGDLWDSGRVESEETIQVVYAGKPLASRQRAWWSVRCWDAEGGVTPWAAPASFEMGLLEAGDWQASWIGAGGEVNAPLFRREFTLRKPVASARAYVCGLGYHELRLNGAKVGDRVLEPNWTDYDERELRDLLYPYEDRGRKRVFYGVHDITAQVRVGANCVGVWLGNGMHNQCVRTIEGRMAYGPPRLLAQIEVDYADGTRETVASGSNWRCAPGPIVFDNVFIGEVYDARREQPGWDRAGFDDAAWMPAAPARRPAGRLQAQLSPPDRVQRTLTPRAVTEPKPGVFVFDLGENFSGWARLAVAGPAGTEVKLRFAEELTPEGLLDFRSVSCEASPQQEQRDVYILKGEGTETWEPRFAWHGFRYVELTGTPGRPDAAAITGCVVHADVASSGEFSCSEPVITRTHEVFRRTLLANLHGGVPSDCPQREKLGYTGDGQLTAEAAMCAFAAAPLYRKWAEDILDAQHPETGYIPHTVPYAGGGGGHGWGSAVIVVPWHLYQYYGDRRFLARSYPAMQKWLEFQAGCTDEDGIIVREIPGSWCLGDWAMPGGFVVNTSGELPHSLGNTAWYGMNARLLSRIAGILGRPDEAGRYEVLARRIASDFHQAFFDAGRGCYAKGLHGAEAFALALGAVPTSEAPRVVAHLLAHLERLGGHADTGIFGTPLLLEALEGAGHGEAAVAWLAKTTYPSFGWMLERGATTLWECWDEDKGSHNHPMYGSVCAWFYRALAGIRVDPDRPGFGAVEIRPPARGLASASATIRTLRGPLGVSWRRADDIFELDAIIPCGTRARIELPCAGMAEPILSEGGRAIPLADEGKGAREGLAGAFRKGETLIVCVGGGTYGFRVSGEPRA